MVRKAKPELREVAWIAILSRSVLSAALWFALAGFDLADAPAAVIAVIAATWASLSLLAPTSARPSVVSLLRLVARFFRQSLIAGLDVAWRALSPSLPLRPGFTSYRPRLSQGPALSAYCTLMSLLPGSLPAWQDDSGTISVHCLDVRQPVAAQMAQEEGLFIRALGVHADND